MKFKSLLPAIFAVAVVLSVALPSNLMALTPLERANQLKKEASYAESHNDSARAEKLLARAASELADAAKHESNPLLAAKYAEAAEAIVSAPGFAANNPEVAVNVSATVVKVVSNPDVSAAAPALAAQVAVQATYVVNVPEVVTAVATAGPTSELQNASDSVTSKVTAMESSGQVSSTDIAEAKAISAANETIVVTASVPTPVNPTVVSGSS